LANGVYTYIFEIDNSKNLRGKVIKNWTHYINHQFPFFFPIFLYICVNFLGAFSASAEFWEEPFEPEHGNACVREERPNFGLASSSNFSPPSERIFLHH
jgi:hypothetical protein